MMKTLLRSSALAAIALVAVLASSPARACINTYVRLYLLSAASTRAEAAEAKLADGNPRASWSRTRELFDAVYGGQALVRRSEWLDGGWSAEVNTGGMEMDTTVDAEAGARLQQRVSLLYAITLVRLDGNVSRRGQLVRRVNPAVRAENLTRAETLLREVPDEPRAQAYLAEALARDPARSAEAYATLHALAERDVIADPFSYRELARLTQDAAERERALAACVRLASTRGARRCALAQ